MSQYEKGVFNPRPLKPKLPFVLDVKIVFSYLVQKGLNNKLPDKIVSPKLLILLVLLGGQRMNSVLILKWTIQWLTPNVQYSPQIKHLNIQNHRGNYIYLQNLHDIPQKELCIVNTLQENLANRKKVKSKLLHKELLIMIFWLKKWPF